jgi:hypothetical protein
LQRWILEQKPGDLLKLRIHREGKELTIEFRLGEIIETYHRVEEDSGASEKARRIRESLLRGGTVAIAVP